MPVELKTPQEVERMRAAGRLVAQILDEVTRLIEPGISTGELNRVAAKLVEDAGAEAAFLNYPHPHGGPVFPGVLCTSLNEEVVHGIPSTSVILKEGDILSVDCGVKLNGFYGDSARTIGIGKLPERTQQLLDVTRQSLHLAIEKCTVGGRLNELGKAVQDHVEAAGFAVVREFVGHGIGRNLHEEPQVPNFCDGNPKKGLKFRAGMVIAIEPMVNVGSPETSTLSDHWTVVTRDRSLSAHFEHTVAITDDGPLIMTQAA
ncbi:MAG: type I methionyl aminopeptidase [Myxococcales bacterium]|nr:type I methionyl aminopeptidase [Myxococcales bacterium]